MEKDEAYVSAITNLFLALIILIGIPGYFLFTLVKNKPFVYYSLNNKKKAVIGGLLLTISLALFLYFITYPSFNNERWIYLIPFIWSIALCIVFFTAPLWIHKVKKPRITQELLKNKTTEHERLYDALTDPEHTPIGVSKSTNEIISLSLKKRLEHCQIVGATGMGKTSALISMLKHDFLHNRPVIIVDPKGNMNDVNMIKELAMKYGKKEEDFKLFSFADPKNSYSYNPLKWGTADQKKMKLRLGLNLSHEFYGGTASDYFGAITAIYHALGETITFKKIENLTKSPKELAALEQRILKLPQSQEVKDLILKLLSIKGIKKDNLAGVSSQISSFNALEFSTLCSPEANEPNQIDLVDVLNKGQIAYFQVNFNGYHDTGSQFGKMLIQDLRVISSMIESQQISANHEFCGVYIDEFGSFAQSSFSDFLKMARSARMGISILFQSPGDLKQVSDEFCDQMIENTIYKIILRQNKKSNVEEWSGLAGTTKELISKKKVFKVTGSKNEAQRDSEFDAELPLVDYNLIRNLSTGQAVLIDGHKHKNDLIDLWNGKDDDNYLPKISKNDPSELDNMDLKHQESGVIMNIDHGVLPSYLSVTS
jgi:hypothetical protein